MPRKLCCGEHRARRCADTSITLVFETVPASHAPPSDHLSELRVHELEIRPSTCEQLVVRPLFHDAPFVQDYDVIRVDDRAQPVCDDDACGRRLCEVALDHRLAEVVERAGGLVEQQHSRL